MIKSFKHKGLRIFYRTGSTKGVNAQHASRLQKILTALDQAQSSDDLTLPGFNLHALSGNLESFWSVKVNGNWRVTFRFIGQDVELVDYLDYH
jgi:proteic killer suppression protein